ncbi:MAG: adenylyl-sulfate kinase [Myxococcota bacterium]|nr:adenylyl-sulfate kinase [Myxococcota bacterium]
MKSSNTRKHSPLLTAEERHQMLEQSGLVVWLTGLSGSGKSTVAMAVERRLVEQGVFTIVLDGDNIRHGLCGDLGFSDADRGENLRRVGEVASLLYRSGVVTLCAFVSPVAQDRQAIKKRFPDDRLLTVYLATPIDVCEARDPKGLYRKARTGLIDNFTGVQAPYEVPENPDLVYDTSSMELDEIAHSLCDIILARSKANDS